MTMRKGKMRQRQRTTRKTSERVPFFQTRWHLRNRTSTNSSETHLNVVQCATTVCQCATYLSTATVTKRLGKCHAPAMQNEAEMLQLLQMPRKTMPRKTRRCPNTSLVAGLPRTSVKVLQVLQLPRKTRRCPNTSLVAGLPRTSVKVLQVLLLPRVDDVVSMVLC